MQKTIKYLNTFTLLFHLINRYCYFLLVRLCLKYSFCLVVNFISFSIHSILMILKILTKGHKNVSSLHRSTFEITMDKEIGPTADCIIGVDMDSSMINFPDEFKQKIANSNTKVKVILDSENGHDEITGWGHEDLTLTHPTDIVCRTSDYTCPRTLMIKADKAARDLDSNLIEDLKNEKEMKVTIKLI